MSRPLLSSVSPADELEVKARVDDPDGLRAALVRAGGYASESEEPPVTAQPPKIGLESFPAPAEGILVTHFLIV